MIFFYLHSFYTKLLTDEISLIRLILNEGKLYKLDVELTYNDRFQTVQTITEKEQIDKPKLDELSNLFKEGKISGTNATQEGLLFIQWQQLKGGFIESLHARHHLESKISDALSQRGLGGFAAGDIGGGGANMLFNVENVLEAQRVILPILEATANLEEFVIARRINLSEDDWNYEVVFPAFFEGEFNSH